MHSNNNKNNTIIKNYINNDKNNIKFNANDEGSALKCHLKLCKVQLSWAVFLYLELDCHETIVFFVALNSLANSRAAHCI